MTFKILIMGLPGSGKTTLAAKLTAILFPHASWLNADTVREKYNDWDFSAEGRIRQATRLASLANELSTKFVIVDFVAALKEQREIFNADFTIWMDTITEGIYEDTNKAFEQPLNEYNLRLISFDQYNINDIVTLITDCT